MGRGRPFDIEVVSFRRVFRPGVRIWCLGRRFSVGAGALGCEYSFMIVFLTWAECWYSLVQSKGFDGSRRRFRGFFFEGGRFLVRGGLVLVRFLTVRGIDCSLVVFCSENGMVDF